MSSASTLFRGGTLVDPQGLLQADLLVEDGRVSAVGLDLQHPQAEEVDATGLLILPGLIDAHTHIALDTGIYQSPEDWHSGSTCAAYGGVTTVIDFATPDPAHSLHHALAERIAQAAPSLVDYAFHMMIPPPWQPRLTEIAAAAAGGITSIKLYTTYRPNYFLDDHAILALMGAAAALGLPTLVHCENDALVSAATEALLAQNQRHWAFHPQARPAAAEIEAAHRVLTLADCAQAPVVIAHNSCAQTVRLVAAARAAGQTAYCESTPQYLHLDASLYAGDAPWRYILQPPLRAVEEVQGLRRLLEEGHIDMISTDHCGYSREQKRAHADFSRTPGGLPGLETLFPMSAALMAHLPTFTWSDLVRCLAANPAKIYGLWPRKGNLRPGADADLILVEAGATTIRDESLHGQAGYSPFDGHRGEGRITAVMRRGDFILWEDKIVAPSHSGIFIPANHRR